MQDWARRVEFGNALLILLRTTESAQLLLCPSPSPDHSKYFGNQPSTQLSYCLHGNAKVGEMPNNGIVDLHHRPNSVPVFWVLTPIA